MGRLEVERTGQACGATVHGVDLRTIDGDLAEALRAAWLEHHVLVFPDQDLSIGQLERVAAAFGPFGEDPYLRSLPDHPHVVEVRREADEQAPVFAEAWHSDWSFLATPPAGTLLHGVEIPPVGGDTLYADQHLAYDALSPEQRARLSELRGIHSAQRGYAPTGMYGDRDTGRSMGIVSSETAYARQAHPLVRIHPETGRPALFCSLAYTIDIDGLEPDEAQAVLLELYQHCVRDEFTYRHRWAPGMVVLWDNRSVMHSATGGYDGHRRLLRRITIAER